ncbi:hypothetical protein HK100_005660 [Physocladia obscura]|uniref:2,5-diamino-6-ribosylamino-4(3H)-pyrimidinone 5'-phosphate reductase n=1 Tax=Physocladia obscura TaxID=109957 RepID=A0AAD5SRC2_9FUNG|nr:hypothetical protein HK100_005660 [Physocladia obscura]
MPASPVSVVPRLAEFSDPLVPMSELAAFYSVHTVNLPHLRPYTWSNSMLSLDGFMNFNSTPPPLLPADYVQLASDRSNLLVHGSVENDICLKQHPEAGKYSIADYRLLNAGWVYADAVLSSGPCIRHDLGLVTVPVFPDMLEFRKNVLGKSDLPVQIIITSNAKSFPYSKHAIFNRSDLCVVVISPYQDSIAAQHAFQESRSLTPTSSRLWTESTDAPREPGTVRFVSLENENNNDGVDLNNVMCWIRRALNCEFLEIDAGGSVIRNMIDEKLLDEVRMTQVGQIVCYFFFYTVFIKRRK